jgi:hypothetical protein
LFSRSSWGHSGRDRRGRRGEELANRIQIRMCADLLFQIAELRQLRHECRPILWLERILVLELRHQQGKKSLLIAKITS